MLWHTHIIFALLLTRLRLNPYFLVLGALLPDVDNPKSLIGRLFKGLSEKIYIEYGHRGLTHSLLFAGLCMLVPALGLGILSHIILDLMTRSGVKILYPKKTRYGLLGSPLVTGKHDLIISIACLAVILL